ncbi:hypothetical protein T492DRAFT_1065006 [Pavlovales sp. CCMP2436]|nr:hypothetical protein T492DRAFT_1065006 [Pavlovales sp. CCMP2436]
MRGALSLMLMPQLAKGWRAWLETIAARRANTELVRIVLRRMLARDQLRVLGQWRSKVRGSTGRERYCDLHANHVRAIRSFCLWQQTMHETALSRCTTVRPRSRSELRPPSAADMRAAGVNPRDVLYFDEAATTLAGLRESAHAARSVRWRPSAAPSSPPWREERGSEFYIHSHSTHSPSPSGAGAGVSPGVALVVTPGSGGHGQGRAWSRAELV